MSDKRVEVATMLKCFGFALALSALLPASPALAQAPSTAGPGVAKTRAVLLGVSAGRTSWRGNESGGTSTAVVVGTDVYVVDFGRGWLDSFYAAGLAMPGDKSAPGGLETLRAAFVTHLHADHLVDYPRLVLFGATDGLARRKTPLQIFGPGRVTDTARMFAGLPSGRSLVHPSLPAPGIRDMTLALIDAFATDLNDNMADGGMPEPASYLDPEDILVPASVGANPGNPSPRMAPFQVYRDDNVTVTATLVNHAPIFPAFAYRFDTKAGSIVISGDTSRNENLITLAHDADLLIQEAINIKWAKGLYPEPRTAPQEAKLRHLLASHTDVAELGPLAKEAGVKELVLSHLGPPTLSKDDWLSQVHGFDGRIVVGERLMSFDLLAD